MKSAKRPSTPKSKGSSKAIEVGSKKNILNQIDKLKRQIQNANDDIQKTQKMLDVDLFLKQQKQKRLQYAKQLNADYEAQKKMREEKLYKKYKKQEKQENTSENNNKIQFKTANVAVLNPIIINKEPTNLKLTDPWVKQGHHFKPDNIQINGLREQQQKTFENLYKNPNQKIKYDGQVDSKRITWKNIKQIADNPLSIVTIPLNIQQNSLIPNEQNSENILSALTLMTPKISNKTFAQNDKIIIAQFFAPSSEITVIIDKNILVRQFVHKNVNLGSRANDPNILWPTLIQKCFFKLELSRNLPHLSSSINQAIQTIYGLDAEFVAISNKNVIKQNFYLVLGHLLQQGKVGFINYNGYSSKTYQNRVYILEQVKQHVEGSKQQQKKEIKFKVKNPWKGKLIDSQNVNRFTLLQLLQMFNGLVILRDYPKKWVCLRLNFAFYSNGAIGVTNNEWTKNPQYLFTITKTSTVRIVLRKNQITQQEIKKQKQKQQVYGFLLFHNKEASNKIQSLKMECLITKTKSTDINEASYCIELPKGNYIVIPYCTQKSQQTYKHYVFDFFIQKESNIEFGKARFFDYNFVTKKGTRLNSGDDKIIQSLESTQKFQKPKIDIVDIPPQFVDKISQKILQGLNLNLFKNVSLKHFFIPGLISNLIINKQIQVEIKNEKKSKQNKNQQMNQELSKQQMAENLQYILGYDAQSDQINQGLMKDYIEQSVGVYDFQNYGLGQEGLAALLQALNQHPQIVELDLKGNELNDYAITFLCYYMEKGNRAELRKLNVAQNKFGKVGRNALQGLKGTFPKLQIIGCS